MKTLLHRLPAAAGALCLGLGLAVAPAWADDHEGEHGDRRGVALLPKYVQECGSCHVAYPPGLLGADSWQRQMAGLQKHYGSDASLAAADQAEIARWLQANAGSTRRVQAAPADNRITRGAWFVREHDEVSRAEWARVKSASNCEACHTRAAEGSYREREIRIPR